MADAILTACSVLYISLPVIIFFWGWLNIYFAIPASLVIIFSRTAFTGSL